MLLASDCIILTKDEARELLRLINRNQGTLNREDYESLQKNGLLKLVGELRSLTRSED